MKLKTLFILGMILLSINISSQVLISESEDGDKTPHQDAALHIISEDKGLILPIVTKEKMPVANIEIKGMIVYCSTDNTIYMCNGTKWDIVKSGENSISVFEDDASRDLAISSPKSGDMIYNSTCDCLQLFTNAQWKNVNKVVAKQEAAKSTGDNLGNHTATQWLNMVGKSIGNVGYIRGSGNKNGALRVDTGTGYLDIGPKNSSWAHITTDRPRFYFNQPLHVDSGLIGSYDEDLNLRTGGTTRITVKKGSGNVGIGTINPTKKLDINGELKIRTVGDAHGNFSDSNLMLITTPGLVHKTSMQTFFERYKIGSEQIIDQTISSEDIKDNSITANDLAPNSVSYSELAKLGATKQGQVLTWFDNLGGYWAALDLPEAQGDNLGNHTATGELKMSNQQIKNVHGIEINATTNNVNKGVVFKQNAADTRARARIGMENNDLYFQTGTGSANPTTKMTVLDNGNVGIGAANPTRGLSLAHGKSIAFGNNSVVPSSTDGLYWNAGTVYGIYRTSGNWSGPNYQQLKLNWATGIILNPGTGPDKGYGKSYVEVQGKGLRVTSGTLGIGITTPSHKLDVNGMARFRNIPSAAVAGITASNPSQQLVVANEDGVLRKVNFNSLFGTVTAASNTSLSLNLTNSNELQLRNGPINTPILSSVDLSTVGENYWKYFSNTNIMMMKTGRELPNSTSAENPKFKLMSSMSIGGNPSEAKLDVVGGIISAPYAANSNSEIRLPVRAPGTRLPKQGEIFLRSEDNDDPRSSQDNSINLAIENNDPDANSTGLDVYYRGEHSTGLAAHFSSEGNSAVKMITRKNNGSPTLEIINQSVGAIDKVVALNTYGSIKFNATGNNERGIIFQDNTTLSSTDDFLKPTQVNTANPLSDSNKLATLADVTAGVGASQHFHLHDANNPDTEDSSWNAGGTYRATTLSTTLPLTIGENRTPTNGTHTIPGIDNDDPLLLVKGSTNYPVIIESNAGYDANLIIRSTGGNENSWEFRKSAIKLVNYNNHDVGPDTWTIRNDDRHLGFYHNNGVNDVGNLVEHFSIDSENDSNNVDINIGSNNGTIETTKIQANGLLSTFEVLVSADPANVPDYVFEEAYNLPSIEEVETFIVKEKHLPNIPSAKEIGENGMQLKEMTFNLLRKIEELTLYTIAQNKQIKEQNKKLTEQTKQVAKQGKQIKALQEQLTTQQTDK
jgi:hypothetical protein